MEPNALRCCVYHGNRFYEVAIDHKPERVASMAGYSVVLTTYDSCVAAFLREKSHDNWLYETEWKRIMIDEGHIIKNDKLVCGG